MKQVDQLEKLQETKGHRKGRSLTFTRNRMRSGVELQAALSKFAGSAPESLTHLSLTIAHSISELIDMQSDIKQKQPIKPCTTQLSQFRLLPKHSRRVQTDMEDDTTS